MNLIEETYAFDDEIESNTFGRECPGAAKQAELGGDVDIRSMRGIGYILRMA